MEQNLPPVTTPPNDPVVENATKPLPPTVSNKNKKLLLFVAIVLVLIALGATSLTLFQPKETIRTIPKLTQDVKKIQTKGTISIEPKELTLPDKSLTQTVYVVFDAGDQKVSEVSFGIEYETGGIENVEIKAYNDTTSALGQSLQVTKNDFYPIDGKTTMQYKLKDGFFEQKGNSKLAVITFTTRKVIEYSDIKIVNPKFSYKAAGETFKMTASPLHIMKSE